MLQYVIVEQTFLNISISNPPRQTLPISHQPLHQLNYIQVYSVQKILLLNIKKYQLILVKIS